VYTGEWTGEIRIKGRQMVTTSLAAAMLGVSEDWVRRRCDSNQIPYIRHPRQGYRLIRKSYIEHLLKHKKAL
jgi:hypothetical protein